MNWKLKTRNRGIPFSLTYTCKHCIPLCVLTMRSIQVPYQHSLSLALATYREQLCSTVVVQVAIVQAEALLHTCSIVCTRKKCTYRDEKLLMHYLWVHCSAMYAVTCARWKISRRNPFDTESQKLIEQTGGYSF